MAIMSEFEEGTSTRRRAIWLATAAALLAVAGVAMYWFWFRGTSAATAVAAQQEATVTRGSLVTSLSTTGTANATLSTKLTFATSGQVKTVSVAVGDQVKAGQELARLDDKVPSRQLETAQANLQNAQIKLSQMQAPPTADALASAQQAVINAQNQVLAAQGNLDKANSGPADSDVTAANAAILQAQNGLTSAQNQVDSAWTGLINAQRNYCTQAHPQVNACYTGDIPLGQSHIDDLNAELRNPVGTTSEISSLVQAAQGFLSANMSYVNAKNGVATAQTNLDAANAKKAALYTPATDTTMAQLKGALDSANAGLTTAQAKLAALIAGPLASDLSLQQQQVRLAQISVDSAQDTMDALILRAPFDGTIGAVGINVGDQVGGTTAAITLTNLDSMRVDLTVSETDLPGIKTGQYGIATFDALPGKAYVVKITGVSTTPTTTQGVVTYPVQAQILRQADVQGNQAELQKITQAFQAAEGGNRGTFASNAGPAGGANGAAGNGQRANASRTPGVNASRTPGASANGGAAANGQNGNAQGFADALLNAPLPAAGMSATVVVVEAVQSDVLLVPTTAIKRQGRTTYVLVPTGNGATEQRTVTTAGSDNSNTAIATGLNEGDKVVIGAATTGNGATATRTTEAGGQFGPPGGFGGNRAPGGVR
ncbi:MAG: HlyD family efflux transporter periplasmic adaptor subunit [Dehalococcoidia bacterium]|nr:HlyD family efflux transporter periplasmic adaptor subunit [Dehalococcoidia bacterium]